VTARPAADKADIPTKLTGPIGRRAAPLADDPAIPHTRDIAAPRLVALAERGTIEKAELILGLKRRNIQAMAARGELPGAAKFGSTWTFDLAKLRQYVKQGEERAWAGDVVQRRRAVTGAGIFSGAAFGKTAAPSDGALRRTTSRLRLNAMRLARAS
jgi:hypothetical protein